MISGGVCGAVVSPGHHQLFRDGSGFMGYYVRAFCTSSQPPSLQVVLDALASNGVALAAAEGTPPEDLRAGDWEESTGAGRESIRNIIAGAMYARGGVGS